MNLAYYGLLALFVFEYLRPTSYLPALNIFRLNTIIPICTFLLSFAATSNISNFEILKNKNTKLLIGFLFLIFVSILTADVTLYSFNIFKTVFGYSVIYLIICKEIDNLKKLKGVFNMLVFIHVCVALLSPALLLNPEERRYIASGVFLGDGNDFALSINIVIPFCIFLLLESKNKRKKIYYYFLLLFLISCVIATSSRGGTFTMISIFIYQWIKSRNKTPGIIGIGLLVVLIMMFAPSLYFKRMSTVLNYQEEGSAMGRILAWKAGLKMAADHPLLGVGAGHFPVKYGVEYRPEGFLRTEIPWQTAHSIYFLVLGELGLPGIILLGIMLCSNFRTNEKLYREMLFSERRDADTYQRLFVCLNSSLIGFAIGGMFLSVIYYPHLYIILGLFVSVSLIYKKGLNNHELAQ